MKQTFRAKLTLTIIVLTLFFLTITAGTAAAQDLVISVSKAAGSVGDTIAVKVRIDNAANTEGGQFVLNFDPELLKPVSIEAEEFVTASDDNLDMANLEYGTGQLMFMWITAKADTDDSGILCTVIFELLKEGETLLEIDEVVISPEGIDTIVEPGSLAVSGNGVAEPVEETDSETDVVEEENDQVEPDQVNDAEEAADEEVDTGTSSLLIIIAILAVLAVAGLLYTKILKKPGAKHAKKK